MLKISKKNWSFLVIAILFQTTLTQACILKSKIQVTLKSKPVFEIDSTTGQVKRLNQENLSLLIIDSKNNSSACKTYEFYADKVPSCQTINLKEFNLDTQLFNLRITDSNELNYELHDFSLFQLGSFDDKCKNEIRF